MKQFEWPSLRQLHGALPLLALLGLAGCKNGHYAPISAGTPSIEASPTLRLVLVTDLAGVVEPCGCTRDQLGGIGHFAAWLSRERTRLAATVLASAGPQFFMDMRLSGDGADQARARATVIARLMHALDWAAFAPASSDWADGEGELTKLAELSGATALRADDAVDAPWATVSVREVGGLRIGFVGVLSQTDAGATASARASVRRGFDRAKAMGANAVVALAAVGRGEAKRIADAVPELLAVVVGSASSTGEQNVPAPEPERVGNVAIVQAANHLQSVAVLDIYLRDPIEPGGIVKLSDGTGIELAAARSAVERRREELRTKIAVWERDPAVLPSDLQARRQDLAELDDEARRLEAARAPAKGNYYRSTIQEIRDTLGSDPAAEQELASYYKAVNEHNRTAFADRLPLAAGPTEAGYVGGEACATCHADARNVWLRTRHASAYATLERASKEFNLDCVSCHVTGYEKPGGSSVTHVEKLRNVQCESCHGPGSKHVLAPSVANLVAAPAPSTCLECHRPPHVENFNPAQRMASILGPGHGLPARH
jgi:hypothetical protein